MYLKDFDDYASLLHSALGRISHEQVQDLFLALKDKIITGKPIFLYGNGGSLANCAHISGDYTKTFSLLGYRIKIFSPGSDACFVSAAANDLDYSQAYEMHAQAYTDTNSLAIFLSGSGNSLNLIKAFHKSMSNKSCVFSICGYDGGMLMKLSDKCVHLPVLDMEISEDLQMILFHFLKQRLVTELQANPGCTSYDMPKYSKRVSSGEVA
jgi:D-sedoheptulose 7-phosphate isomerase